MYALLVVRIPTVYADFDFVRARFRRAPFRFIDVFGILQASPRASLLGSQEELWTVLTSVALVSSVRIRCLYPPRYLLQMKQHVLSSTGIREWNYNTPILGTRQVRRYPPTWKSGIIGRTCKVRKSRPSLVACFPTGTGILSPVSSIVSFPCLGRKLKPGNLPLDALCAIGHSPWYSLKRESL
jgi:hypothetical protein